MRRSQPVPAARRGAAMTERRGEKAACEMGSWRRSLGQSPCMDSAPPAALPCSHGNIRSSAAPWHLRRRFLPRERGAGGESHFFMTFNRGKKSVALDFTKPEGQAIVHKLLASADVLVENFRPGVLKKYGLDYRSIHARYPGLIYLSISAYGQSGPLSDRPGYDPVLPAESGMMRANGEGLRHAIAVVDTMTAIHSAAAINAALFARTSTGKGQHIDLALYDTA